MTTQGLRRFQGSRCPTTSPHPLRQDEFLPTDCCVADNNAPRRELFGHRSMRALCWQSSASLFSCVCLGSRTRTDAAVRKTHCWLRAEMRCAPLQAKDEKWPAMRRYQHKSLAENHNAAAVDAVPGGPTHSAGGMRS